MRSPIHPEHTLNCRFPSKTCVQKTTGRFIAEAESYTESEKRLKLVNYINMLQGEMKKVDGFKRELPLTILLLTDAVFIMREELDQCKKSNEEPVLEEFIPLKRTCTNQSDSKENDIGNGDKKTWMSSVQLCISNNDNHPDNDLSYNRSTLKLDNKKRMEEERGRSLMDNIFQNCKNRIVERAFVPQDPGLSLCTTPIKHLHSKEEIDSTNVETNFKVGQQQNSRKQRRCWSPELHRRFVNALNQLGGPQVATPKQIRELMHVDGLTNDEVKSHLQKYRLHARRVSTNTSKDQSGSPNGHLQLAKSSRGSCGDGDEDEDEDEDDERSESHSWV